MAYSEKVIDHYQHPRNVGSFGTSKEVAERSDIGVGVVGAPECGDVMQLQIKVDDEGRIVEELSLPPVKIHCSVLAEDSIRTAIEDYRKKNGREDGEQGPASRN
jgi:nitrogen fixation NifU-like protein